MNKPFALRLMIGPLLILPASGCVAARHTATAPLACSKLIPAEWSQPVPGAPLPTDALAVSWMAFADAQTGQLDKANARLAAVIGVIERCEARDARAVRR